MSRTKPMDSGDAVIVPLGAFAPIGAGMRMNAAHRFPFSAAILNTQERQVIDDLFNETAPA